MINIVEYKNKHRQAVTDLIVSIFVEEYGFEHYRESCSKENYNQYKENNGNCWVALDENDTVVGCIALENNNGKEAHLKIMYVHNDFRGLGIAQKLFNELYNFAIEKNFEKIYLGTYERLGRAIGFYKKNGFKEYEHDQYTFDDKYFYLDVV